MNAKRGFIDSDVLLGFLVFIMMAIVPLLIALVLFSHIELSEKNVSGIVYNTSNNGFISGKTKFSVRAAVDTYVSEENQSSYCLPPGSQYIDLVNRAARDKNIKVQVTTRKGIWRKMPWTCADYVKVEEVK